MCQCVCDRLFLLAAGWIKNSDSSQEDNNRQGRAALLQVTWFQVKWLDPILVYPANSLVLENDPPPPGWDLEKIAKFILELEIVPQ